MYAVVFDTRDGDLNVTATRTRFWDREGSEEEAEDQIWTADGQWFAIRYRPSGSALIGGREYRLSEGRVFLVRRVGAGSECEQLAITLPPREGGTVNDEYVGEGLAAAAAGQPELAAFLGMGAKQR